MDLTRRFELYDTLFPRSTKLSKEEALSLKEKLSTATPEEQEIALLLIAEHARRNDELVEGVLPYSGIEKEGVTTFEVKNLPPELLTRLFKYFCRSV